MKQRATFWGGLGALALLALGGTAQAQGISAPPTGGNGFKVGSGRLHPFFDLETRLDSGVGYFTPPNLPEPDMTPVSANLASDVALRFRPGFRLEIPSSKLEFNLGANLDYVMYTGLVTKSATTASRMEGAANLNARFNPDAPLSVEVSNQFARSDRTRTAAVGVGVLSLFNEARVRTPWRPGGGALELIPSAAYAVEFFQPLSTVSPIGCNESVCAPSEVERFDYGNLRVGAEGRWRFLPKTAFVLDTNLDVRSYFNDVTPSASLLRAMGGVAGLVSPKVAVVAKAGWGQNLASTGGGTFLGQLEGTYLYSPTLTFKAGYLRMIEPVAAYNLFVDNRGYGEVRALFGGKLTVAALVAVDFLRFDGGRNDTLYSVNLGPEYQFYPWLTGAAGYMLGSRSSSVSGGGLNFTRHEGFARLSVTY
ncbi:hypothetical protein A176_005071 [Myxococcus hansupus]|uniref:Uncharacterized protein n=1 Tax=Pseudomyxococcus hansupus TaxID=1297742 RepID=A0A0H4WZD6_9BACT|nr:hypothetical protein [Myxococcus hansupus]AKQ68159.1 hypothetical protein A176_005071 [Myxococcus hansupus]